MYFAAATNAFFESIGSDLCNTIGTILVGHIAVPPVPVFASFCKISSSPGDNGKFLAQYGLLVSITPAAKIGRIVTPMLIVHSTQKKMIDRCEHRI